MFAGEITELTKILLGWVALVSGANVVRIEMLASGIAIAVIRYWFLVDMVCYGKSEMVSKYFSLSRELTVGSFVRDVEPIYVEANKHALSDGLEVEDAIERSWAFVEMKRIFCAVLVVRDDRSRTCLCQSQSR